METRSDVVDELSDFKTARDAMVHADEDEFIHHVRAFVKELDRNKLCQNIVARVPSFDVDGWWKEQTADVRERRRRQIESLDLPGDKDAQLAILLDFTRSFASDHKEKQISAEQFGYFFGKNKRADCFGIAQSFILRPLAEELSRRLRKAAALANPDVRDLAGVPLARIPANDETRIFLSHKWANKEMVRRYHAALRQVGFSPWLDEEAIVAGETLHRALDAGMERSCAAVFFVTTAFQDEKWIRQEVDLAMQRKVERGLKFQVITLVFGDGAVPQPLRKYVYIKVEHELDGIREIVRALPIELGPARWKETVVEEK